MPYKTFSVGEVLTASDVNTYLMKQTTAVVTSGTRPPNPVQGQMIYETDTQSLVMYTGSVWEVVFYHGPFKTYVPEWTATTTNPSIGDGTLTANYRRLPGRMVWVRISWARGSTTNFGDGVYSFSLPPGLPAETGQRWLGQILANTGAGDSTYQVQGLGVIHAGGDGTTISRVAWQIAASGSGEPGPGDLDNWSSNTQASAEPSFEVGGHFLLDMKYETTYLDSDESDNQPA